MGGNVEVGGEARNFLEGGWVVDVEGCGCGGWGWGWAEGARTIRRPPASSTPFTVRAVSNAIAA